MTLFIQNDTAIGGTGAVFPNNAEADLFRISELDFSGFGETTEPPPSHLIKVDYEPQGTTGFPPTRLHELVNTDFAGVAGSTDIIVVAVTESFLFDGNTPIENVGGVTLPPLQSPNTTGSVLIIYNTGSSQICTKAEGSGGFDLGSPSPVTLFHELSHAFRMATTSSLSASASGCTASPEEEAAEKDENEMRELMGVRKRDVTNHCGEHCSSPSNGCCVVASIATGSESVEVNALRAFREGFLRRSEVGHSFFEQLHYEYYGFSPQVCAAMGNNEPLVDRIRTFCVRPLTRSLTLLRGLLAAQNPIDEIGTRLDRSLARELDAVEPGELDAALAMIRAGRVDPATVPTPLPQVERVDVGSHLRWGILDPVEMYLLAAQEQVDGADAGELGRRFASRVDAWAPRLPLDPIWGELSNFELRRELNFLRQSLLRTPASCEAFARRLLAQTDVAPRLVLPMLVPNGNRDAGGQADE